jgi:MFS transporter, NNP family, nitrate/nitrite transporter
MWEEIKENGYWQGQIWNKRKNGDIYQEWLTISAIKNEAGEIKYYAGLFSDLTSNLRQG